MAATYEDLAAELDCSPEFLRRLSAELGLPPAGHDRVREEDAKMLSLLRTKLDLADEDELSSFARLYGGTIQRLVGAGLQSFDRMVRQRVANFELSDEEKDRIAYEKAAGFTELVSGLVPWLQRRHREHAVLEYLVSVTEGFMEERGISPRQPRQPPRDRLPRSHGLHRRRRGARRRSRGGAGSLPSGRRERRCAVLRGPGGEMAR